MPRLLTDAIHVIPAEDSEEVEDIFSSAPGLIFTDDTRNSHGDSGSTIVYKSARFGDIELKTADPEGEAERQLFGQYLWNAGILMAKLISGEEGGDGKWGLKGRKVLELGSGVGLGGIVATLADAEEIVISDYPARAVLENIRRNAQRAIPQHLETRYSVEGHVWGGLESEFASRYAGHFDRMIAADCLWMPAQHENLARSMAHLLTKEPSGKIFVIAGFHTGRAKLAQFFNVIEPQGLEVEEIYEEDVEGLRREWMRERDGGREDVTGRKRWLVIARLRRRRDSG